ncbi:MAG TPA: M14 family zinc carboxypeptidase, partial [Humisphaera sp.]
DADGVVHVRLMYDYERASPNRAGGHFHFQVQGKPGSDLTLVLHNFDNVYNGRFGAAVSPKSICYVSADGKAWRVIPAEFLPQTRSLRVKVHLDGDSLYLARIEPYRLSDLDKLVAEIRPNPLVEVTEIGRTVEGRPIEVLRVGDPAAPYRVFVRGRAHPWEPGGSWVAQGLIRGMLADDDAGRRARKTFCLYTLPMANKDGVARGRSRFNLLGKDLNRDWDKPADPHVAPENAALEAWVKRMAEQGKAPHFAVDLHNDEGGGVHVSRPPVPNLDRHLERMKLFERLLRQHTWFTEGSSGPRFRNVGTIGEGLLERYGIDACVMEFNCNWVAGIKAPPTGAAWEEFGRNLRLVFADYFDQAKP